MSDIHLEITKLSHSYRRHTSNELILNEINLSVIRGELLGLLGPSGCGKTTLLRLIAGFERPVKGQVFLNNKLISSSSYMLPPERRDIGMVFQDYALFPHLTLWKNICFGIKSSVTKERARWLMQLLGLSDLKNYYPHELSGGQKQRVALARSLAPGSSLIVLDEPFCSLDVEVRNYLRSELSNVLRSCSATGILVTHDPSEALGICDRVAVMKDGKLQQCDKPSTLLTNPATPFVGKFVSQNNLVKLNVMEGNLKTPYGSILVKKHLLNELPRILMFDETSLDISLNSEGRAFVTGKEFRESYWILRVRQDDDTLRVNIPLDREINLGDRCDLKFIYGKYALLYPGCVSCILT